MEVLERDFDLYGKVDEKEAVLFGGRSKMEELIDGLDEIDEDYIFFP